MTDDRVIASATKSVQYGNRRQFNATVKLYAIGNQSPYFSTTGEDLDLRRYGDNRIESCGCLHDEIVTHFPEFAPVVRVHLANERGKPMSAESNALYWGGFSPAFPRVKDGEPWRQMSPRDDYGRIEIETDADGLEWSPKMFANHLRVSVEEGRELRAYVANDETKHYSAAMHFICQTLQARWQRDADEALQVIRDNAGTDKDANEALNGDVPGMAATVTYGNNGPVSNDEYYRDANPWTVRLRYQGRSLTVPFWTGSAITEEPTAGDVLSCVVSDALAGEQDFAEFCSEFGYDEDSRNAEKIHRGCVSMSKKVRRFLGDDFDRFAYGED